MFLTAVGSAEYTEEPATKVAFQTTLNLPGCSASLSLLGTGKPRGYRIESIVTMEDYHTCVKPSPTMIIFNVLFFLLVGIVSVVINT